MTSRHLLLAGALLLAGRAEDCGGQGLLEHFSTATFQEWVRRSG